MTSQVDLPVTQGYTGSHEYAAHAQWPGDDESKPAPGPLRRVQALVNTVELPDGPDRLADPADARPWLVDNQPAGAARRAAPTPTCDLVRGVREALRAMLVHNAGGPTPTDAVLAPLREVAVGWHGPRVPMSRRRRGAADGDRRLGARPAGRAAC